MRKAQDGTLIYIYPNAPHGFDNSLRAGYAAATANLAREHTLDFLAQQVG